MWRIKSVDISGLLGRYNIHWDLDSNVNILGGGNGSGKSTLLKAILMQFSPADQSGRIVIHSEAVFGNIHSELQNGYRMNVDKSVKLSNKTSEIDGHKTITEEEEVSLKISSIVPDDFAYDKQKGPTVIYVNSIEANVRHANSILSNSSMKERPATSMLDLLIENSLNKRNAIFSELMSKAIDSGDDKEMKRVQDLFGRFSKVLKEFMPDYSIQNMSTLTFKIKDVPEESIRYFKLSSGEKQLIYLLLTIANTMGEPTIALLDEADMGMHVDWKRMLLKKMLEVNPNMQIIASTHSPALIDGWRDNVKEISELCVNA